MNSTILRSSASRVARFRVVAAFAAVATLTAPAFAQRAASFQGLGDLPGDYFFSAASAVSADGSVVVGESRSAGGDEAFLWTREGGMRPLGGLYPADGGVRSSATAVSADGTVVAGSSSRRDGTDGRAFRWTASGGMQSLGVVEHPANSGDGNVTSIAYGVSADGSVIVGQSGSPFGAVEPFRWTAPGGIRPLGKPGQPRVGGAAYAISADGSTVVGSSANMPFRWSALGGLETLEHPGLRHGTAAGRAVSADGSVVVGWFPTIEHDEDEFSVEDFRWTREGGLQVIRKGDDSPHGLELALSVSADGSVVLGADGFRATLWTREGGVRLLSDVLTRDYGLDLTGWTLEAGFVSADGSTIVGRGVNPSGRGEAFLAVIPEPSSSLAAIVFAAVYYLRRPNGKTSSLARCPSAVRRSPDLADGADPERRC